MKNSIERPMKTIAAFPIAGGIVQILSSTPLTIQTAQLIVSHLNIGIEHEAFPDDSQREGIHTHAPESKDE